MSIEDHNHRIQKRFIAGIIFLCVVFSSILIATTIGSVALVKSIENQKEITKIRNNMETEVKELRTRIDSTIVTMEEMSEIIEKLKERVNKTI